MSVQTLTCQEVVEIVTDYLEGSLSRRDRKRFEEHLAACDGCTTYVEQMRQTIRLSGMVAEGDLTPDAREALLAAFRTWRSEDGLKGSPPRRRRWPPWRRRV